jgi:hypothetical protein
MLSPLGLAIRGQNTVGEEGGGGAVIVSLIILVAIAVVLVTRGVMIILAKGLLRRAVDEDERPSQAGWLTVSLLPDGEDGGPLTSAARLNIILFTEDAGGPQA